MKIVFFNKTKQKIGGGLLQFFNLAKLLSETKDNTVYYVNYYNSQINVLIDETDIIFMDVENIDEEEIKGALFVTPLNYCLVMATTIPEIKNARILLYDWHPNAAKYLVNQFLEKDANMIPFYQMLVEKNALVFMDKSTQISVENYVGVPQHSHYIPVVKEVNEGQFQELERKFTDRISIGWLGRLDNDKIHAVINVANNIMASEIEEKVDFHIIGDGNKKHLIPMEKYAGKIRFIFTSYLFGDDMYDYLAENIDVLFSMGTAALNGAEVGLPVAIVPISDHPFYTNEYVYLFDTRDYTLGWKPDELQYLDYTSYRIEDIIRDSLANKSAYGRRCFEHFQQNHILEVAREKCLQYIRESSLTGEDLYGDEVIRKQLDSFYQYQKSQNKDYLQYISYVQKVKYKMRQGRYAKMRDFCIRYLLDDFLGGLQKKYAKRLNLKKYKGAQKHYEQVAVRKREKVQRGEKLRVAFLVIYDSVFPALRVFQNMLKEELFEPRIIVIPDVERGIRNQVEVYTDSLQNLQTKFPDYVIGGYNIDADEYLELGEEYDIIFFSNPYKRMAHRYHNVEYFLDKDVLTFYANYGFFTVKFGREIVQQDFYNYVWKVFLDSKTNYEDLKKTEPIKGKNGVVVGYMKMDNLAEASIEHRTRKRILICPHHTVMGWNKLDISNFLKYSKFFLKLPELYPDIDFVFRPHPMLFSNLLNKGIWSEEEIMAYIDGVNEHPNMYYDHDGDYLTTFANSDAMIHDCASFTAEYLFTEKPCCYMLKDIKQIDDVFLPMGKKCMQQYYRAFSEQDIQEFIEKVVMAGEDSLKQKRETFARQELKFNFPNSAQTAIDYIKSRLS